MMGGLVMLSTASAATPALQNESGALTPLSQLQSLAHAESGL